MKEAKMFSARNIVHIFLAALLIFGDLGQAASGETRHSDDIRLQNMKYELVDTDTAGVKKYVMEADFKGTKDRVCGVICDYYNLHTYMPKEFDSKVLKEELNQITLDMTLDLPWPFQDLKSVLLIDFDKERGHARWKLISGNLRRNDGTIEVEQRGSYSHVKQTTYLDIGRYYPDWFITIYTRSFTYRIMRAIRARLEAKEAVQTEVLEIRR